MSRRANISVVVFFFAITSVFGQGLKFGVFFDPAFIKFKSDAKDVVADDKFSMGFDLGMSTDYYFSQNYAVATGISLLNTRGTLTYENGIKNFHTKDGNIEIEPGSKIKYNVQYVKIPLGLKFKTHKIGRMVYSANPGLDFITRASAKASFKDEKNASVNKEIKFFNMGWHFMLGASYSLGGEAAILGGLSFMNTFVDMTAPMHDKITSQNLFLCIGLIF